MPIKVEVSDALILLAPETDFARARLQIRAWEKKNAALGKIDKLARERLHARRPSLSDDDDDGSVGSAESASSTGATVAAPGWKEKLAAKIIGNMRVDIHNVHIRYEDGVSDCAHPFAFGITIAVLQMHTTNDRWEEVRFYVPLHFKRILLTILTCPPRILTLKKTPGV